MDGNTSTKHMANAGHVDHCMFPSMYMIPPQDVDTFRKDVRLHLGDHDSTQVNKVVECTDNWKAANSTDEDTVHIFEQTGIFLSACRHGIIQTVVEMRWSGELGVHDYSKNCRLMRKRAKYPLAMINKLLNMHGANQAIGSNALSLCPISRSSLQPVGHGQIPWA